MERAYFDHNATTRVDPEVLESMIPYLGGQFGNASSRHTPGTEAMKAVRRAREQVANSVKVESKQVIFTSGGTEANNLAIKGLSSQLKTSLIAISDIEHPCVRKPSEGLAKNGWTLKSLAVSPDGVIDLDVARNIINEGCELVSIMLANNETGVLQPVNQIADFAKAQGALVHTDAIQALGKVPLNFNALGVQAMSISAHKLNGPKGVGALIVDKSLSIAPLIEGGGHEYGIRSGTLNVPAIVGFGTACDKIDCRITKIAEEVKCVRDDFEVGIMDIGGVIFGNNQARLPNTSYFSIPGIAGETLVIELDNRGFAVSSGAACSSDSEGPSQVLSAMGIKDELALGAVRVSFGPENTAQEADRLLGCLHEIAHKLKTISALTY